MRDGARAAVTIAVALDEEARAMPGRERALAEFTARAVADLLPLLLEGARVDAIESTAAARDAASQRDLVNVWNELHRPGRAVAARLDDGREVRTRTRAAAELLGGHTAVVWMVGIGAAYALERVRPIVDVDERQPLTVSRHHVPDQQGGGGGAHAPR